MSKKADQHLNQSRIPGEREAWLENIIAASPNSITVTDLSGKIIECNQATLDIYGYASRKEILGKSAFTFFTVKDKKRARANLEKTFETGFVQNVEYTVKSKDGRVFPIKLSARVIKDESGQPVGFVGITEDITDLKRAEQKLRDSEERFRQIVELTPEGILTLDRRGCITSCNPGFSRLTGYSKEELVGRHFTKLEQLRRQDIPLFRKIFQTSVTGRVPKPFEIITKHKNGNSITGEIHIGKTKKDGKTVGLQIVAIDITERKRAEEETRQSREEFRNLSAHLQSVREQERRRIAREIHDDLGQKLTALKMDVFWMSKRFTEDQRILLEKARSMSRMIDQTIATVKRISTELRPGLLDDLGLAAAIEWQAREFQLRTGVSCEVEIGSENMRFPQDLSVSAFRIFQEALTNVTRHSRATRVAVRLIKKDDFLLLEVSDNGRGITREQIHHPNSLGIIGMRERASSIGGDVEIDRGKTGGTSITMKIPLPRTGQAG